MIRIVPYQLQFAFIARTSRNEMRSKACWFVIAQNEQGRSFIGECAPIFGLSHESQEEVECALQSLSNCSWQELMSTEQFRNISSVQMAVEMIRRATHIAQTPIGTHIPINGLVWMNDVPGMLREMHEKVEAGFRVIKLKIGAQNFEDELNLLRTLRSDYAEKDLEIRLDANGAFSANDAFDKLEQLAQFGIHSIEQPIAVGKWKELNALCKANIVPIALDEELIGLHTPSEKERMLDAVQPHFIVLKPSLHGAFSGCDEWIQLAHQRSIGWWATSALESSAGLDAIAQWSVQHSTGLPQGLGTGSIYTNNLPAAWQVQDGRLVKLQEVDFTTFFP